MAATFPIPQLAENKAIWLAQVIWAYVSQPLKMTLFCYLLFSAQSITFLTNLWPYSERALYCVATFAIHEGLYFGLNGLFLLFDRYGIFERYKINRTKVQDVSPELWRKTMVETFWSHFVFQWPTLYFAYDAHKYFGSSMTDALPSVGVIFATFLVNYIWLDFSFYVTHRILHLPRFYGRFHKQHHEYNGTIGFAAEYSHPVETILSAQIPTVLLFILGGSHFFLWFTWLAARLSETYITHSGYAFPWDGYMARYHDFHHSKNVGVYAGGPLLDLIFGTCDQWIAHEIKVDTAAKKLEGEGKMEEAALLRGGHDIVQRPKKAKKANKQE